jgi:cardiolipin synthase A/B
MPFESAGLLTQALISAALIVIHVSAIVMLLLAERRQPTATLAWLLALVFLPLVGVVLYLLIGATRQRVASRSQEAATRIDRVFASHDVLDRLQRSTRGDLDARTASLLKLGQRVSTTPPSHGNSATVLHNAAMTYRSMLEAIENATNHIHVEFYIIQPDRTGIALRDRLTEKARGGVEVRVLVDGLGSLGLPAGFWQPLQDAGGQAAVFRPVLRTLRRLSRRDRVDFRNHRKIVVTDGKVGFTGGINVGREYLGLDPEMGRWRDTHVRIAGPSVLALQRAFAEDWLTATGELIDDERFFPSQSEGDEGDCMVQIVDSGPDRPWSSMSYIYTQAIALARERLWITNPYFVPSPPIFEGLIAAALRGIDVRILLPKRSDSLLVSLAAASFFKELLEAGVRIFQYERGFIHAKTMLVDSWVGTIGSANLDMRSFNLNFELNAFVYGEAFVETLAEHFLADLENAVERDEAAESKVIVPVRLARAGARLLSPML